MFVRDTLQQKYIDEFTYSIENCLDVVAVEMKEKNGNDILVACKWHPPNVCMNKCIENYECLLQKNEK